MQGRRHSSRSPFYKTALLRLNQWVSLHERKALVLAVILGATLVTGAILVTRQSAQTASTSDSNRTNPLLAGNIGSFRSDCIDAVLEQNIISEGCRSASAMQETYGVNVWDVLDEHRSRMIMTARLIARGDILTQKDYEACLGTGKCAPIPLLGEHGKDNVRKLNTPQAIETRRLFWYLVEDGRLTRDICAYMDTCRALEKIGLIGAGQQRKEK